MAALLLKNAHPPAECDKCDKIMDDMTGKRSTSSSMCIRADASPCAAAWQAAFVGIGRSFLSDGASGPARKSGTCRVSKCIDVWQVCVVSSWNTDTLPVSLHACVNMPIFSWFHYVSMSNVFMQMTGDVGCVRRHVLPSMNAYECKPSTPLPPISKRASAFNIEVVPQNARDFQQAFHYIICTSRKKWKRPEHGTRFDKNHTKYAGLT